MRPSLAQAAAATANQILDASRDRLLGDRPFEGELVASLLCGTWYTSAPPLQVAGLDAHPLGEWPNVPLLRLLDEQLDAIRDHDAALALTRVLVAQFDWDGEPRELGAALEARLASYGAEAPEWTLQLDGWRLSEAHEVRTTEGDARPGSRIMDILAFEHPSGDRHGLALTIDAHSFNHIAAIDAFDDVERFLDDVGSELAEHPDDHVELVPAHLPSLGHAISRSISKTYLHEFDPIRYDQASIALLSLAVTRSDCVYAAAEAAYSG